MYSGRLFRVKWKVEDGRSWVFISGILGGVNVNMQEADPGNGRNERRESHNRDP